MRAAVCALLGLTLDGCISPDVAISHRAAQHARVTMRDPETGEVLQTLTKSQLQNRLFDLCDLWASLMKSLFDPMIDEATNTEIRSSIIEQKLRSCVSGYTIAVTSDPVSGMLDMMVLSRLLALQWAPGPRVDEWFGEFAPRVSQGLADAEARVWKIGGTILSTREREELTRRIDRWIEESPDLKSVSFARLSDIDSGFDAKLEADVARSQGLLDVIDEAMRSAEELHLLGERSLWLASRAPILIRMTTEASLVAAFDVPQVQEAMAATLALPEAVDRLSGRVHEAVLNIDEQRKEIVGSFDSARESLRPMLNECKQVLEQADSVIREARKFASERNAFVDAAAGATKDLRETIVSLNAMADRFFPPGATGSAPEVSRAISDLAIAAEQFNAGVAALQTIVRPGETGTAIADISKLADAKIALIGTAGDAAIDKAFWRGLTLIAFAFVLAVAYKFVVIKVASR